MFGAGKRKTRRPARFADYQYEDDDWSGHATDQSRSPTAAFSPAPSERLEEEINQQLAEVSKTIERLQLIMTEARIADRQQNTSPKSRPTGPRHENVIPTSLSRELVQDDLPADSRRQDDLETASRRREDRGAYPLDSAYPSLHDIRADRPGKQGARPKYSPPPLPTGQRHTNDIQTSYSRTLSREFGQDGRGARGTAPPTASRRQEDRGAYQFDSGYPSLNDIRAMNNLKDPRTSADRTFRTQQGQPPPRSTRDRKSDVTAQSRFGPSRDYSPDSDDDRPYRGQQHITKSGPLHEPVEMAGKTGLPAEEGIDQMKLGKLTRLLQELGITEDETDDLDIKEARAELKKRIRDIQTAAAIRKDDVYSKQMEVYVREGKDIRMPRWRGSVPPIPEWTSLIHDCLKKDPMERPKIQECLHRISAMKVLDGPSLTLDGSMLVHCGLLCDRLLHGQREAPVLAKITFENFCRFENATIDLDTKSTSLLGENGKTTVLKGIKLFTTLFDNIASSDSEGDLCSFEYPREAFQTLLGIKDYKVIWHKMKTTKPIQIIGQILNKTIRFKVHEDSRTVNVTCNYKKSELSQIGCPITVSISNTGRVFRAFEDENMQSQDRYNIHVDNINDISCLVGLNDLKEIVKQQSKATKGLQGACEKHDQHVKAFIKKDGGINKTDSEELHVHYEMKRFSVERQDPNFFDLVHNEKLNKHVTSDIQLDYLLICQARADVYHAAETLNKLAEQYKQKEANITECGKRISELLSKYGIREGCTVKFTVVKRQATLQLQVHVIEQAGALILSLSQCDAGLQQVIIIMLMVLYVQEKEGKKPMHLLLDEPVSLFHGNLVRKLLQYLKQEDFCVVLACHAVDTLMACKRIISLDDDDGPYVIPQGVKSELDTFFRGNNRTTRLMKFSKTLKTKCILIVEGETDADVLKAWIKRLHNGIDIDDKVGVYINSGRPNTYVVRELVGCLDASHFRPGGKHLKILVLTDRDFKTEMDLDIEQQEVSELNKEYEEKFISVKWHCYKRNELENYLLSAAALKSCLDENSKAKKKVTIDEIQKRLDKYIEEYFPFLQLIQQYRESAGSAIKRMPKGSKQKNIFKYHRHCEEEATALLKQRASFTDAKEVLKCFGIQGREKYEQLVRLFPQEEIDIEIHELTKDVLDFFKISRAADGPSEAADGPSEAADGPSEAADGPSEAADGPSEAADGPSEAADGPSEAADGPSEAADGPSEAADGPSEAADGPSEAADEKPDS